MNSIYRLRPLCDYAIDELKNHYLWFSKRVGFRDVEDANIGMFIDRNPIVQRALEQIYTKEEISELAKVMDNIGICCFTTEIPTTINRKYFPNGLNSFCVEYDINSLKQFFLKSPVVIPNCFKDVVYHDKPITIQEDGDFHYLAEQTHDEAIYKSILELKYNPRSVDRFLFFLLTRIKSKFAIQKEKRIFLSGYNLKNRDTLGVGYKINVSPECIKKVRIYENTPKEFVKRLESLELEIVQL